MNTNKFIEASKSVHGDKYDYSKAEYVNPKTKVCVICPKHGEFWQAPYNHMGGQGCGKCRYEMLSSKYKKTNDEWIGEAISVHGGKYDYSKAEYNLCQDKVCIICPIHGEFWQRPLSHIQGQGCPYCTRNARKNADKFIEEAKAVHGDKYDYSKVEYKNSTTKVRIVCPIHGEFLQSPKKHLVGHGCQKCNKSRLESKMSVILERNGIEFEEQKKFGWLGNFELDFYLPKYNTAIECQGIQHFKPVGRFGGDGALKLQKEWDERKRKLCTENGVKLLYFSNSTVMRQNGGTFPYEVITDEEELVRRLILD